MIQAENITKSFGNYEVLADFSLQMEQGCIYGVVGYNGAGKTTLMKTIAGIYRPETGRVLVNGEPVYENEQVKRSIFMVQDEPYFAPQGTLDAMALFYSGYYPAWSNRVYRRLLHAFGLDGKARISSFSKGMQRQASLILGLSTLPYCLLLDESFDGLDLSKRNMLKSLLQVYLKSREAVIVVSSHNLRELEGLCGYIAILRDKRLSYAASVEEMHLKQIRYRVVFGSESGAEALEQAGAQYVEGSGVSFTFVWNGERTVLEDKLAYARPLALHTEPLALEDIFLREMEEAEYDFSGIFQ
ncbi:MAG: hypothetical protein K0R57_1742 [Paenibacillaceae bacterium]|jgi:ABC-2 type transport system ATP-binding protein|nr:hypothetical protein [Paenibacillaceae bacterium]